MQTPAPQKEHAWLSRLVGDYTWESEGISEEDEKQEGERNREGADARRIPGDLRRSRGTR